jgi:hypothetical protein
MNATILTHWGRMENNTSETGYGADDFNNDFIHPKLPDGWLRHVRWHQCFDPRKVRCSPACLAAPAHHQCTTAQHTTPHRSCPAICLAWPGLAFAAPANDHTPPTYHTRPHTAAHLHAAAAPPYPHCTAFSHLPRIHPCTCPAYIPTTTSPRPAPAAPQHLAVPVYKPPHHYSMSPLLGHAPKVRDILLFFRGDMGIEHGDGKTYSRNIRQTVYRHHKKYNWEKKYKVIISYREEHTGPYGGYLRRAVYCLAPPGEACEACGRSPAARTHVHTRQQQAWTAEVHMAEQLSTASTM